LPSYAADAESISEWEGMPLIEPHLPDKSFTRSNQPGQFKTQVNMGQSISADRRHKSNESPKVSATMAN
jgi:hypothetical protein